MYVFDALPTLVGSMAYAFSLPYELPYAVAIQRRRGCGTTVACNDGPASNAARAPWAEEVEIDEVSSIDKVQIASIDKASIA